MNPRFSIIIPHKDVPQLLQRCLDSIPVRDDVEVIVVDDNSSPDRVDFEHFPTRTDIAVRHFFPKEGRGAGYARNIGLDHARGEWVLFADADDYYITDALNEFLEYVINDNPRFVIFSAFKEENGEMNIIPLLSDARSNLFHLCAPWKCLYYLPSIKQYNIWFEEVKYGNDVFFSTKVGLLCGDFQFYYTPFYVYCIRSNSLTTTISVENVICRFNVCLRQVKLHKKHHYKLEPQPLMNLDEVALINYWLFLRCLLKVAFSRVFSPNEFRQFYLAICKESGISKYPFKSMIVNRLKYHFASGGQAKR